MAHTVEFSNKLDGSMQSATWYNGEIVMAGSQAINPENSWRLQDGYRMIRALPGYEKMLKDFEHHTFIFEYMPRMWLYKYPQIKKSNRLSYWRL